jgi:methylamine---glutamate N-methyltransferase subunit B
LHAADVSGSWRVLNPRGAHALAVGIDAPLDVEIEGHAG